MRNGVTRRHEVLRALQALGGQSRCRGGETLVHFRGTTITVGRRDFSRRMLRRLFRHLANAQITEAMFWRALDDRTGTV